MNARVSVTALLLIAPAAMALVAAAVQQPLRRHLQPSRRHPR